MQTDPSKWDGWVAGLRWLLIAALLAAFAVVWISPGPPGMRVVLSAFLLPSTGITLHVSLGTAYDVCDDVFVARSGVLRWTVPSAAITHVPPQQKAFGMRLGIISDTHGHLQYAAEGVAALEAAGVDTVLHCGDIGVPAIVPLFSGWPTHFVFGNTDCDLVDLRYAIQEAGQSCHERFGDITLDSRRIAMLHGDDTAQLMNSISSQDYDLICYGHTHEKEQHRQGRTLVLNPGAVYRASPHSVAVVDLSDMTAEFVIVEPSDAE
ncbi:MAG: YfcE family phosphodiesterase [Planctomycetaceae bacterium]